MKGQPNVQHWSYIERQVLSQSHVCIVDLLILSPQMPQQNNFDDCGVFACCSMLTEALNLEHTFNQSEIIRARQHILLQVLRRTILLSEYNLEP